MYADPETGNGGRELGVAQSGERTGNTGDGHREDDGGAGMRGRSLPGQHKDSGANHRSDAERDQIAASQDAFQRVSVG